MNIRFAVMTTLIVIIAVVCCGAAGECGELPRTRITLVAEETVYFNAGTSMGVNVGDSLPVVADGDTTAFIVVTHTATHSAAAKILAQATAVTAGDMIALRPYKPPAADIAESTPTSSPPKKRSIRQRPSDSNRLKGSISVQNQWHHDMSGSNRDWYRPSLRTRLTVANLGGTGLTLQLRHRTRMYYRSEPVLIGQDNEEWTHHVYELSIGQEDREGTLEWGAGRITAPYVRGVGMIDGGYMAWKVHPNYRIGFAAGASPDYQTTDLDFDRRKVGLFAAYESGSYKTKRLGISVALTTAYEGSTVSRDFLYLQGTFSKAGRLSLYQSVEVDLNRSWRHDRTGERFTFANYYATANVNISKAISVFLSYDARKNLLYYENRDLPDSLFDDNVHKGFKAGLNVRISDRVSTRSHVGVRYREEPLDNNLLGFFSLRLNRFPAKRHSVTAQLSVVETQFTTGYRPTLLYRFPLARKLTINATGAGYIYKTGDATTSNYYINLNGMYNFGRRYYFTGGIRQYLDSELESFELVTELGVRL